MEPVVADVRGDDTGAPAVKAIAVDARKRDGIERLHAFAALASSRGTFLLLVLFAVLVGGVPVLLSIVSPHLNTSIVLILCTSGQFFVSLFAGVAWSKSEAVKEANTKWVPMAASACDRLATILGSVSNLRATVSQACSAATKNLPELAENTNRAVKIHFEGLCSSNATRLNDIQHHLDSALADWERFVKNNCSGSECADIGRRLAILQARSEAGSSAAYVEACSTNPAKESIGAAKPQVRRPSQLEVMVSGVTTAPGRNGRWILRHLSDGFWECDLYTLRKAGDGWFLEEKSNKNSYFFLASATTQCGVYDRCDVCPLDGKAVVFHPVGPIEEPVRNENQPSPTIVPPSSPPTDHVALFLNVGIANNRYLQHVILEHQITEDHVKTAIKEANTMSEFSAMLGIECADVVSPCAVPIVNALRALMGRSALQFDADLHARLCARPANSTPANPQAQAEQGPTTAAAALAPSDVAAPMPPRASIGVNA